MRFRMLVMLVGFAVAYAGNLVLTYGLHAAWPWLVIQSLATCTVINLAAYRRWS